MKARMTDEFKELLKNPDNKIKLILNAMGAKGYETLSVKTKENKTYQIVTSRTPIKEE